MGFFDDEDEYTAQAAPYISGNGFGGGLLADRPTKKRGFTPDLGLLGLAAGLLEPTRGGKFSSSLANGLSGWASGIASQRKLDMDDIENDPDALGRKYMMQAEAKAKANQMYGLDSETWGMAPFVDKNGKVYQFSNRGTIRELPRMEGRYQPNQITDLGGQVGVMNPGIPGQPLMTVPKTMPPGQAYENRPDRFTQTPNDDGTFTQTDTNTGKKEIMSNPNGPKTAPQEFVKTLTGFDNFNSAIDRYIGALKNRSLTDAGPKKNLDLESAYGDLTMINKDIYGLGVLNAGDKPALERVLRDPTSPSSVLYSNDDLIKQAEQVREDFKRKREALIEQGKASGYRIGNDSKPIRASVPYGDSVYEFDFKDAADAERTLNRPDVPPEIKEQIRSKINEARGAAPYSVNSSSMPALKAPDSRTLENAKAKLKEFEGDPAAYASVKAQIQKKLQDAGFDPSGL